MATSKKESERWIYFNWNIIISSYLTTIFGLYWIFSWRHRICFITNREVRKETWYHRECYAIILIDDEKFEGQKTKPEAQPKSNQHFLLISEIGLLSHRWIVPSVAFSPSSLHCDEYVVISFRLYWFSISLLSFHLDIETMLSHIFISLSINEFFSLDLNNSSMNGQSQCLYRIFYYLYARPAKLILYQ